MVGSPTLTSVPFPFSNAAMPWGPTVAEELQCDGRFALGFKVGKRLRPLTDTERDLVAAAVVEHIRLSVIGKLSAGRRGAGLRIWGGGLTSKIDRMRIYPACSVHYRAEYGMGGNTSA